MPENKKIEKINREFLERDKKKNKSILDKISGDEKEVIEVIEGLSSFVNKDIVAKHFIENYPLYYDNAKLWWFWNKKRKCWEKTDEVHILNLLKEASKHSITSIKSTERTEVLNALKQRARQNKPKPAKKTWLQFNDEIMDLETGDRFFATPEYFITNPIPWNLGYNEETPNMDRIFEEWVGKDYVKTLYEIIAYSLLPNYPLHRLFCLIGEGLNGKTCFLRLLKIFLGIKNITSTELDVLLTSRFEKAKLHRKLVCIMGETNFSEISQTSTVKKLTGQDLIGFEYKNKDPFEDENYAKILIATNNLPTTTDKTIGFYRRWTIIDFPNKFTEDKDILDDIPDEEYNNLALKSIEILYNLLKKRKFHNEGTVEDRMKKYEAKSDFLQKFLDEFTTEDSEGYITKADFRKKFKDWCESNRHRKMAENTLSKKLKQKGVEVGKKYFDWLKDGKGGQLPCYLGIKWKN